MSSIHYKFRSSTEYDTITFDTQSISLNDLREAIMLQKKIVKSPAYTLEITNAQTKEVYTEDDAMVPKNSSVIVKRVPIQRLAAVTDQGSGLTKEEEELTEMAFMNLTTTANLVNAKASEADKIKAMMKQSSEGYDPLLYQKRPPQSYICSRCGLKGHFVKQCPTQGDSRFNHKTARPPSGIPREYIIQRMKREDELIMNLRAVQNKDSRFSPVVGSELVDHTKVPAELQCPMCKKLFTDVVVTPCCGESYCDDCIRNYLVEHDLTCVCGETTSPDNLIANKSLRTAVNNFRNQKKSDLKSVPTSPATTQPPTSFANGSSLYSVENQPSPQPAVSTDADQTVAQNPPDVHSESSQSSSLDAMYANVPSPKVGDLAVMNSPRKQAVEGESVVDGKPTVASQSVVVQPQMISGNQSIIAGQIPQHMVPGSQAFHTTAGTAIYTSMHNSIRPNYILPQQQVLQQAGLLGATIQYGINLPTGATIVKRYVPVPVGPRLAVPQMTQQTIPHGSMVPVDLNKQMFDQNGRPIRRENVKGNLESPMPLTEDEFYLWQNQYKHRRHVIPDGRDSSRERHQSQSKSPPVDKRRRRRDKSLSQSADESSQERKKKKEKVKRRHRDSSQESRGESTKVKNRTKHVSKNSSRHLPKHIQRELDEFEFDNEIEFDEELRKVRKASTRKKARDENEYINDIDFDAEIHKLRNESRRKTKRSKEENTPEHISSKSASIERTTLVSPDVKKTEDAEVINEQETDKTASEKREVKAPNTASGKNTLTNKPSENGLDASVIILENHTPTETKPAESIVTPTDDKPKRRTRIVKKKVIRFVKVKKRKGQIMSKTVISEKMPSAISLAQSGQQTPTADIVPSKDAGDMGDEHKHTEEIPAQVDESALPENSRWETGNHTSKSEVEAKSVKRKTNDDNPASPTKKVRNAPAQKETSTSVKSVSPRKKALLKARMLAKKEGDNEKEVTTAAKKESYKRALEKAKKMREKGSKSSEDEDMRRKREKYSLLKQKKLKERALAEKLKLQKEAKEKSELKVRTRRTSEQSDDSDMRQDDERRSKTQNDEKLQKKPDQHFYKPGDAKLKSISEMSKRKLKQAESEHKKMEVDSDEGDVLKSKVTSIKKLITMPEKRRVIKTSVSDEEKEFATSQSSDDVRRTRRIVKLSGRKKVLSSKVEKTEYVKDKRKFREESAERRKREKSLERERKEALERFERRQMREEEEERKELKKQRELERERKERKRVAILEQEKHDSLVREKLALREKDRLERKLMKERELREELMREKEEDKFRRKKHELASKRRRVVVEGEDEKSSKRSKKRKEVIEIDVSEESESESSGNEKEKKKKRRSKKKKKKKKRSDDSDEEADSDDSSNENEEEEEERKKKKKKKHKRRHKKHRKSSKKHKKKSKKKKTRKEKSESESEDEDEKTENGEEEVDTVEESEEESEDSAKVKKSTSSDTESAESPSDHKDVEDSKIKKDELEKLSTVTESEKKSPKVTSEDTKERTEKDASTKITKIEKAKKKSSAGDGDDLELDYNEDLGDLEDGALYEDLHFADDEQTNPENTDEENKRKILKSIDDYEDGEILDDDLFSTKPNASKVDGNEKDLFSAEPNEIDIENAVDDAINELSLDISSSKIAKENDASTILEMNETELHTYGKDDR